MTINKDELRRLAEAAMTWDWYAAGDLRYHDDRTGEVHGLHHDDDNFVAAANPATILALLDELEAAQKDARRMEWMESAWGGYTGKDGGFFLSCYMPKDLETLREMIDAAMKEQGK